MQQKKEPDCIVDPERFDNYAILFFSAIHRHGLKPGVFQRASVFEGRAGGLGAGGGGADLNVIYVVYDSRKVVKA